MTTLIIDQTLSLQKTHFSSLKELYEALYEEILEEKMQYAKNNEIFVDF